jgi:hypothetical protein
LKEKFPTKFNVLLVDPPYREYSERRVPAPSDLKQRLNSTSTRPSGENRDYMTFDEIARIDVGEVADYPSVMFLWAGSHHDTMVSISQYF